ncbi:MAG: acetyl-CoA C-acetyltransferase [Sulfobacillus sp.]
MNQTVVVSAKRTPFGKLGGALHKLSATDLGAHAIRQTLQAVGQDGAKVDEVIFGMVVQAGAGQIPSRQAAMAAGIPQQVPSTTVNKVCASSLHAVNLADAWIRLGERQVVVAGGMESMSQAPYLLPGARFGYRMGDGKLVDAVVHDGLWCSFGDVHMGVYGSEVAAEFGCSRQDQDAFALRSHQLASQATDRGVLAEEIAAVELADGQMVRHDEAIRADTSLERLAKLRPVFGKEGTVTAGNAPGLNDGASALLLMSEQRALAEGRPVLAKILASGQASDHPRLLATVPAQAAEAALAKLKMMPKDVDLWEINEAFASVTLISQRRLGIDIDRVNPNGGAIAFGHPIGASGGRILLTLIYALRRQGGGIGVAAICSGGGQGEATVVEVSA